MMPGFFRLRLEASKPAILRELPFSLKRGYILALDWGKSNITYTPFSTARVNDLRLPTNATHSVAFGFVSGHT